MSIKSIKYYIVYIIIGNQFLLTQIEFDTNTEANFKLSKNLSLLLTF